MLYSNVQQGSISKVRNIEVGAICKLGLRLASSVRSPKDKEQEWLLNFVKNANSPIQAESATMMMKVNAPKRLRQRTAQGQAYTISRRQNPKGKARAQRITRVGDWRHRYWNRLSLNGTLSRSAKSKQRFAKMLSRLPPALTGFAKACLSNRQVFGRAEQDTIREIPRLLPREENLTCYTSSSIELFHYVLRLAPAAVVFCTSRHTSRR